MKVGVLTSSRADYGIYLPLLRAMKADSFFQLSIIAFGTHLSPYHGRTIEQITTDGFEVPFRINALLLSDDENGVASSFSLTALKFAEFWQVHRKDFDVVLCLGDRFEMFAAVSAGIPFGIRFAHIHGGETTLGAIDNVYRHSISLASAIHFTSTVAYSEKVKQLTGSKENIYTVGALSLDNLQHVPLLSKEAFQEKWNIDMGVPSVLITIHPETVNPAGNRNHVEVTKACLEKLAKKYQLIITMPNADTLGTLYRACFQSIASNSPKRVQLIENFGTQSYFTAMHYSKFLLGNTSSGIIEAATFKKYVINVGERQRGRFAGENVLQTSFNEEEIFEAVKKIEASEEYTGDNPYYQGGAVNKMLQVLKAN
jgi:GDP/UDP-N,N'-diacetylbacillosamine 2-epimerase (hydrolysing)